jgi:primosomal protein N''
MFNIKELKTSAEWEKCHTFQHLVILDADGWNREPKEFQYSFYKELITRQEFERRLMSSTIMWSLRKL